MLWAKPIPPCRAGVYSRRLVSLNPMLRREQAPALRCNPIITQIGRENNISAEIVHQGPSRTPVPTICKHPYENERKASAFFYEIRFRRCESIWRKRQMLLRRVKYAAQVNALRRVGSYNANIRLLHNEVEQYHFCEVKISR